MMMTLKPMTVKHLQDFLENVRPLDLKEAEAEGAIFVETPLKELDCMCLVDEDDNVYAIGDIEPQNDAVGYVWMLCTRRVETNKIAFLRASKELLKAAFKSYAVLGNKVLLENKLHVDWLTWMGAIWLHKTPDEQFQYFVLTRR